MYNFLKTALPKTIDFFKNPSVFIYLLAAVLITIPLENIYASIAIILFVITAIFKIKSNTFSFNTFLVLPLSFYFLMVLSLIWTHNFTCSLSGLQKELPFLVIPVVFAFLPKMDKNSIYKVYRLFSLAMVFYGLYYLLNAVFRYAATGNKEVFFYHELVNKDLNAIYVSVFASFAVFYFISLQNKKTVDKIALFVLSVLIFLLSSKSIITIDFILIICYYSFFAPISKGVKTTTITTVVLFVFGSLFFVKEVKERFLLEYETAFVDNTVNNKIGNDNAKVYNISLKQAWNNSKFEKNNFFPGTALRVYQMRIFTEMLQEQHIFFTGFGLEASQEEIQKKCIEHQLYDGYGDFNFHNQYVQTFSELGIFGFLILLGMLHLNFKKSWREKDFLHIAFAITMIILFLSESFFCRQRGIVFFITIYCMFNSVKPNLNNPNL